MKCNEIQERYAEQYFSRATGEAPEEFTAHLAECAACAAELERLRSIWARLGWLPEQEPGPALRAGFEAMLAGYERGLQEANRGGWRERAASWYSAWLGQPVWQGAMAALLLLAGWTAGLALRSSSAPPAAGGDVAALRVEVANLRQSAAISMLGLPSASDRLRGVTWSREVANDPRVAVALLKTLEEDPNVNVRLAALDVLRGISGRPGVRDGLVRSLAPRVKSAGSPLVQVSLIDALAETLDSTAVDALQRAAGDPRKDPLVRERARRALAEVPKGIH